MEKVLAKYFVQLEGESDYIPASVKSHREHIFIVEVDGKEYEVDYVAMAEGQHSFIINNVSYGIEIDGKDNSYTIQRADDFFKMEVLDEMKKFIKERVALGVQGRQVIDTQMPGLILKVLVEKGQEVQQGDPLMILVAMKMENEIKSPKSGVVQEIYVEEGKTVASGDKLIIIE